MCYIQLTILILVLLLCFRIAMPVITPHGIGKSMNAVFENVHTIALPENSATKVHFATFSKDIYNLQATSFPPCDCN